MSLFEAAAHCVCYGVAVKRTAGTSSRALRNYPSKRNHKSGRPRRTALCDELCGELVEVEHDRGDVVAVLVFFELPRHRRLGDEEARGGAGPGIE